MCSVACTGYMRSTAILTPATTCSNPTAESRFLDYGLVKYFTDADALQFERLIRSMLTKDASDFRAALVEFGLLRGGAPFSDEELYEWFSHYYEIVLTEGPVTVTPEYASSMVRYNFRCQDEPNPQVRQRPALVRSDPAHQSGPLRDPGPSGRHRELPGHRRRALAVGQCSPEHPHRRSRSRLAIPKI